MDILTNKMVKRSIFMLIIFSLIASLIVAELFKLQILGYDDYQSEVLNQLTVETNVNPNRGIIYDRNGRILATNKTVWVLYLLPKNIKDPELIAKGLSEILNIEYSKILDKAKKTGYKYQIIDTDLEEEAVKQIRLFIDENQLSDQIQLNASAKRYYPFSI